MIGQKTMNKNSLERYVEETEKLNNFSLLLQSYRHLNKISIRTLAKKLDISISTLSRIEHGHVMDQCTLLKVINWLFKFK